MRAGRTKRVSAKLSNGVGITVLEGAALELGPICFPLSTTPTGSCETTVYEAARDRCLNRITEIDTDEGDLMPAKGLALEDQTTKRCFRRRRLLLTGAWHRSRPAKDRTGCCSSFGDIDVPDVVSEGSGRLSLSDTSSAADTELAPVETTQTTIPASGAHFVDVVALARYVVSNADLAQAVFAGQAHQFNLG